MKQEDKKRMVKERHRSSMDKSNRLLTGRLGVRLSPMAI